MEQLKPEEGLTDHHAPKPLSTAQNIILTMKVLGGGGVLIFLLWLVEWAQS